MIWARFTFGLRSFHATANTTKGKLVTTGPYHWLRHPIYASIIYFVWASVISYPFIDTVAAVILITGGLFLRIILEEKSLKLTYPFAPYRRIERRARAGCSAAGQVDEDDLVGIVESPNPAPSRARALP